MHRCLQQREDTKQKSRQRRRACAKTSTPNNRSNYKLVTPQKHPAVLVPLTRLNHGGTDRSRLKATCRAISHLDKKTAIYTGKRAVAAVIAMVIFSSSFSDTQKDHQLVRTTRGSEVTAHAVCAFLSLFLSKAAIVYIITHDEQPCPLLRRS